MAHGKMPDDYFSLSRENNHQTIILKSLMQVMTTMRHIDELWLWLVQAVVSHFEVQVAQIWANQANRRGQILPELRSMAWGDVALPQNIVVNTHIRDVVQHLLHAQHTSPLQNVDNVFPGYLAIVLKRHGLNYCANCFLSSPLLLPPANSGRSTDEVPTPLKMTIIVFIQRYPTWNILPAIGSIFQQALTVANQQALLLPAETNIEQFSGGTPTAFSKPTSTSSLHALPLSELIPHRNEDPLSNPIAVGVAISDKQMRRLYAAIDDQRNVGELSRLTQIGLKEVSRMLQVLLNQSLVLMYDPSGRLIDRSQFLSSDDL